MNNHSTLTIGFILDYRNKPKGFWQFDMSYEYDVSKDKQTRFRVINPLEIINETPLTHKINKDVNYVNVDSVKATQDTYPMNPIISKPNGNFVQLEDFKGDIKGIKTEKGDGIIFSMGFDYQVNTDKDYK